MSKRKTPNSLWYFAFGANMNSSIFLRRRHMHPISSEPAVLSNYRLVFDHPGIPIVEPAFANIEPRRGSRVHGVLYHMTQDEMKILNRFEGGGAYQNLELPVLGSENGKQIAHVFWTPNTGICHLKPSRRYVDVLYEGAKEHNLPAEWLAFLANQPTSKEYLLLSPAMKYIMPALGLLFKMGLGTPFKGWKEDQHEKARKYTNKENKYTF